MLRSVSAACLALSLTAAYCPARIDQSPHFEVASVKPVSRDLPMGYSEDSERVTYERLPLTNLIAEAYKVGLDQITGPDWLTTEFYAITAKLPPGTTKDQRPLMMANLLAERFGLAVHRVTKEIPGYELTVAAGGPKLTPSNPAAMGLSDRGRGSTMPCLAATLRRLLSQLVSGQTTPIADRIGITGKFDFHLRIPALSRRLPPQLQLQSGQVSSNGDPEVGPADISAAMEKQLGLKLTPVKTSLDFIVVDHVNKVPTEN